MKRKCDQSFEGFIVGMPPDPELLAVRDANVAKQLQDLRPEIRDASLEELVARDGRVGIGVTTFERICEIGGFVAIAPEVQAVPVEATPDASTIA